jgi:hypothetical protein
MLHREGDGTYRLFRRGDEYHPEREKGSATPKRKDLPETYLSLLDWYRLEYDTAGAARSPRDPADDPLLQLVGLGKDVMNSLGGGDAVIRYLRSDSPTTPPWETAESKSKSDQLPGGEFSKVWRRIRDHVGRPFRTKRGLPFTYQFAGEETLRPITRGRPVNRVLPKGEFEKAWMRLSGSGPGELQDVQGSSYVFGILADKRIVQ